MLLQIGAEIFKRALSYPARQIAKNAGVNGSVVVEKVSLLTDVLGYFECNQSQMGSLAKLSDFADFME